MTLHKFDLAINVVKRDRYCFCVSLSRVITRGEAVGFDRSTDRIKESGASAWLVRGDGKLGQLRDRNAVHHGFVLVIELNQ